MLPQLESWGMSAADEATRLDLPFHDKDGGRDMTVVCGIDVGSLRTLSYVAWLSDRTFLLDLYVSSPANPLPEVPREWERPAYIGLDAPQGLPVRGAPRREADRNAKTPTSKLPSDRSQLREWPIYRELIEAGVEMSWSIHQAKLGSIFGLSSQSDDPSPVVLETYPRYVIKRKWPDLWPIPSKRKQPFDYIDAIWNLLTSEGYRCSSVRRPSVGQVDAMLCALAAESCVAAEGVPAGTVGSKPMVDLEAQVLREGYIVSP